MILLPPQKHDYEEVISLAPYHPYWIKNEEGGKTRNPLRNSFTKRILDLKAAQPGAISDFVEELDRIIDKSVVIAVIPPHQPGKSSGIIEVARKLAKRGRIDATSCLVRASALDKKANGGSRNYSLEHSSIEVQNPELIKGREILLLDDVTTSGNSMEASKDRLLEAGAKRVQCFALGKTTH